ncbi:MAG: arginine decarboxylase, pyruvoyl-dependent [Actinomycetota bacterium]
MYERPTKVCLVWGAAEGDSELTAFDNALLKAGIGHLNLIAVTSIFPEGASLSSLPQIPTGTLTPTVYAKMVSETPGEMISSCIGVGVTPKGGVLMEAHGPWSGEQIEDRVRKMVEEGMRVRGLEPYELHFATAEHHVEKIGSAVAAAVLWRG